MWRRKARRGARPRSRLARGASQDGARRQGGRQGEAVAGGVVADVRARAVCEGEVQRGGLGGVLADEAHDERAVHVLRGGIRHALQRRRLQAVAEALEGRRREVLHLGLQHAHAGAVVLAVGVRLREDDEGAAAAAGRHEALVAVPTGDRRPDSARQLRPHRHLHRGLARVPARRGDAAVLQLHLARAVAAGALGRRLRPDGARGVDDLPPGLLLYLEVARDVHGLARGGAAPSGPHELGAAAAGGDVRLVEEELRGLGGL
mmetsp:Transcript_129071/g.361157  ORF Transcript_129071/g.361157 Transcript_129071/m.361157 type:complete len:261 (-) Transcript_129071:1335-2117(-)